MRFRPPMLALLALLLSGCLTTPQPETHGNPPPPPSAWTATLDPLRSLPDGRQATQGEAWGAVLGADGWAQAFHEARRKVACIDLWYTARLWERQDGAGCLEWEGDSGHPARLWSALFGRRGVKVTSNRVSTIAARGLRSGTLNETDTRIVCASVLSQDE